MRKKVVIVGGGVAGLTAAHELIERGYDVTVVERRSQFGGKAASYRRELKGEGKLEVPGEHGFRFFAGWYRNLPHTLERILYQSEQDPFFEGKNVLQNLVALEATVLAQYARDPIPAVFHLPRSATQAENFVAFWTGLQAIGLPLHEALFFFNKMREFVLTPEQVRRERYDEITWWEFLEADKRGHAFRVLIEATTRTTVAAKARQASAYTIGKMVVATFLDGFVQPDCVLNGPTSEVWLDPWVKFLRSKGVDLRPDLELASIKFIKSGRSIECITCTPVVQQNYQRLLHTAVQLLDEVIDLAHLGGDLLSKEVAAELRKDELSALVHRLKEMLEPYPTAMLGKDDAKGLFPDGVKPEDGAHLVRELHAALKLMESYQELAEADVAPKGSATITAAATAEVEAPSGLLKALTPDAEESSHVSMELKSARDLVREALRRAPLPSKEITGDHFIFALPVEQMAYYINRSVMLTHLAPELRSVVRLSESVDWMAGIQFYLKEPIAIPRGSLICVGSEWALTAVQQTQFWRRVNLPPSVNTVLSVDISDWNTPGRFNRLEASRCEPLQVAQETWEQLKEFLNRPGKPKVLRDDMLLRETVEDSFLLDESIVERFDRKKQSAFEKSSAVHLRGQDPRCSDLLPLDNALLTKDRMTVNLEPLLINRCGTLKLRPGAQTSIPNMFLAGDYVDTGTNLACMESANESARLAVNAILNADSSSEPRCDVFAPVTGDLLGALSQLVQAGTGSSKLSEGPAAAIAGVAANWLTDRRDKWKKLWR